MLNRRFRSVAVGLLWLAASSAFAQYVPNRYILVLEDAPVVQKFPGRTGLQSAGAVTYRQRVLGKQFTLRASLAAKHIAVTSSVDSLLNALFVSAKPDRVAELKSLPGVKAVLPVRLYKRKLNKAVQLVNAPAGWDLLGGSGQAGKGMKVAVLDTGIDQNNPAFQDSSLSMPTGFPQCSGSNCSNYTSNKVIVARSYVSLFSGSTAETSIPDDLSPRDRVGHGTAAASCVAGSSSTGLVPVTGVAPKAYLGNYKIYGSPGVVDYTSDEAIIAALTDAVITDGMDVISFSSGSPAVSAPLDAGAICGNPAGKSCDPTAAAFENAAQKGAIIVVAAGNEGSDGDYYPTYSTIASPAHAPSVISVGASTNSHSFGETVDVPGGPAEMQGIVADPVDAYMPWGAYTAPLVDITKLGDDGTACSQLPASSLVGAFALVRHGPCPLYQAMGNVVDAGAMAAIFYLSSAADQIPLSGFYAYLQNGLFVSYQGGLALKNYIAQNPGHAVKINPSGREATYRYYDEIASFSSRGPSVGDSLIKPELVAVGKNMYMASQSYDPAGDLYSSDGYLAAGGTSFSTPMVAGAAALVKQAHPTFSAAQVKSALVNTASQAVTTENADGNPVDIRSVGAGKLDVAAAIGTIVTAVPSTISFGATTALPASRSLDISNTGSTAITLTLGIAPVASSSSVTLALDRTSLTLAAGATATVNATLSGTIPQPGVYYGAITVTGTGVSLRVPYQYLKGDGVLDNLIPLFGDGFYTTAGDTVGMGFKVIDQYGLPVANAPVSFTAQLGGSFQYADTATNVYGIAYAEAVLGATSDVQYRFRASVTDGTYRMGTTFTGYTRTLPAVAANGVVNAASFEQGRAVAPGSYVAIFGSDLSDYSDPAQWVPLPQAIDSVYVTFDVPSAGISALGRVLYVSPGQINLQVPWELQGQTSAQMKVVCSGMTSNVITVPIANASPAFFLAGNSQVAALDGNLQLISPSNAVARGGVIVLYVNGLGPTNNQPATGDPAGYSPLATTTTKPVVMIGGQQAHVDWNGLVPGFPGLYQVNAVVPTGIGTGQQTITIAVGDQTSPAANVAVK